MTQIIADQCSIIENGMRCLKPVRVKALGWCGMHYARWRRNGDPLEYRQWPTLEERFWARIDKNGLVPAHMPHLGPCWIWTGGCFDKGYGLLSVNGRPVHASRVSWELHFGPIPDETPWVLHHCDNPPCPNPTHLFLGTPADNAHDRDLKGRGRWANRT